MQKDTNIWAQLQSFVSDLDGTGKLLNLIGLLPGVLDLIFLGLGKTILIPPSLAILFFFLMFIIASFRVYNKLKKPELYVSIVQSSAKFSNPIGNDLPKNSVFWNPDFHVTVRVDFELEINDPQLNDAHFIINSIDTDLPIDLDKALDAEITVNTPNSSENPIIVKDRNIITNCNLRAIIPLLWNSKYQGDKNHFELLGLTSRFDINISVKIRQGIKIVLPIISANTDELKAEVENQLSQLIVLQANQIQGVMPTAIHVLKSFWAGK